MQDSCADQKTLNSILMAVTTSRVGVKFRKITPDGRVYPGVRWGPQSLAVAGRTHGWVQKVFRE